jgi:hypothetical protein
MKFKSILIGLLALASLAFLARISRSQFIEETASSGAVGGKRLLNENYEAVGFASPHPETDIRGYVLNASGVPWEVPGASVNLRGDGIDQSTSAVGGEYWFHDIPEGHYTLSASAPGYQPFTKTLYVAGRIVIEPYTVLTLAPEGFPISSASGRVIDNAGNPLPNVTVSTDPLGYIEFTDSQGRYRFDYLPSEDWEFNFIATARGYVGNYQRVSVPGGSSVTVPDIVLTEAVPGNRIFFTEDFETDLSGWEDIERPDRMYITHTTAYSGSGSLEMEFRGGPDEVQAGWMHHWVYPEREGEPLVYEGTETIYISWYQRWSENFLFKGHDLYALSGIGSPAATDHTLYVEAACEDPISEVPSPTGRPLVMIRATTDISHICGKEWPDDYCDWRVEEVAIERGRWYRFEVLATMNTPYDPTAEQPFREDGTIRFWLDGVELLNLGGLFMRNGLVTAWMPVLNSYSRVVIGPWYHGGVPEKIDRMYSWIDELVVANYRITEEYPHRIYLPIVVKNYAP